MVEKRFVVLRIGDRLRWLWPFAHCSFAHGECRRAANRQCGQGAAELADTGANLERAAVQSIEAN